MVATPVQLEEVETRRDGPVLHVALNNPARRNALSRAMIRDLAAVFASVEEAGEARVVVLCGNGPTFCAGGDLRAYRDASGNGEGKEPAQELADLLAIMVKTPVPVIGKVHGPAFGGGVGLVSAVDIAIAGQGALFSLSEARLGLVPAAIVPYVLTALGQREAMAKMLLASPFDAVEALRCHLVQQVVPENELERAVDEAVQNLLLCAPGALSLIKRIPERLQKSEESLRDLTASFHLERLASPESKEGLTAFFEKRPPAWAPRSDASR